MFIQYKGFLLAHNRPILEKPSQAAKDAESAWWRSAATWGNGSGYRRGTTALDNNSFLVALARAFSPSALAPATGGGLSNTLNADPEEGLVQATFEQAAWASFKVSCIAAILLYSSWHAFCVPTAAASTE